MPKNIIKAASSPLKSDLNFINNNTDKEKSIKETRSKGDSTPKRKRSTSESTQETLLASPTSPNSPRKWKSPRRSISGGVQNGEGNCKDSVKDLARSPKSPRCRLSDRLNQKPKWDPTDSGQMNAVKEILHVSTSPSTIVCREEEQKRIFEFCKDCIEKEKAGSLYLCGCPGTGKSLLMEKVKGMLMAWAKEARYPPPDALAINCTSLAKTSEIFSKILEIYHPRKKINGAGFPLRHLQDLFSLKKQGSVRKMMLIVVDEMDYLITKDRAVLHDLFMLTTLPFSRCILVGIANAIDLADRFLPKLQSLNCKPIVVTFRAYSKDQILKILQQRLMAFSYDVFQPQALELCARKVAAASGDMRKALSVCRSAIEMLETELRDPAAKRNLFSAEKTSSASPIAAASEINTVRVDHMAIALSKTFKSAIVDTIQSLPQHQQMILCSTVKLFRQAKKDTTIGELNKSYVDICKSALIPPASMLEFSNMCRVLSDQGLFKLGQSRVDKLKRVTLQVDEADITFALQGIRLFRNCLEMKLSCPS